ncbi:hypothetical protein GLOIN_2v1639809 [Rhizophagus clarus]|uniref:BTB domain-containing protein n=1 Tax=Rhizophagus clarus TaxID=94130 RepID=A0A8H3M8L7_9GLOM|nr:hypothetical protein GLOIN_2v1639809 [Rhizophagus clarus]
MSFAHNFFNILSNNYKTLFDQAKTDGDVTIIVGDEKENKTDNIFKAHSLILCTQCPWFKTILSDNKKKGEKNLVINIPNISPFIFNILLKYFYYGEINISSLSGKDIFELLIAMNELKIIGMSEFLQDILLISHKDWLQEYFFFTYKISLKHQELKKLRQHFDDIIQFHPDILFYAKDFVKIDKVLLMNLIKKDNLALSEIDIWRKLILWGKNSINNSKLFSHWNDDDFKSLKSSLEPFFPLIRFNRITSINYYYEIRPYEKIIPEKVKEGIIQYHLTSRVLNSEFNLSPRLGVMDSTVITSTEAAKIATWLSNSTKPLRFPDIPYEFKLLLRGSQDGFNSEIFHSKCLDKFNTLVVIRIAGTRKIIGGYNPLAWKKCVEWKPVIRNFGSSDFGFFGTTSSSLSNNSGFTTTRPQFSGFGTSSQSSTFGNLFGFSVTSSSSTPSKTNSTFGFGILSPSTESSIVGTPKRRNFKSSTSTPSSTARSSNLSTTNATINLGTSPFSTLSPATTSGFVGFGTPSSTTRSSNLSTTNATVSLGTSPFLTSQPATVSGFVGFGTPSSTTRSSNLSTTNTTVSLGTSSSSTLPQLTSTTTSAFGGFGTLSSSTRSSNLSQMASTTNVTTDLRDLLSSVTPVTTQGSSGSSQVTTQNTSTSVTESSRSPLDTTGQQTFDFLKCNESFIFSFNYDDDADVDVNEIKFTKSDVKDYDYGIGLLLSNSAGPIFGNGDLIISGNNFKTDKMCSCNQTSYKKPIMDSKEKFSVDEYEVFQINIIPKLNLS